MGKRTIGIIDLVSNNAYTRSIYGNWVVDANQASIMPQVVAAWCEQAGHTVEFVCYTGSMQALTAMADRVDIVFIATFTRAAQAAYAISNLMRARGVITVIGGPHARCYPQDARKYFDYVLGFTDKTLVEDVVRDCSSYRPLGVHLSAAHQPVELPGMRARWKFQRRVFEQRPLIKMVHMLGSLGCPYTCSFCMDADVPYQTLDFDCIRDDLRFLRTQFRRPIVAWDDPNFGIRFDDYMSCIEEAVPPDSISFIAHTSLSILKKDHLPRLQRAGFKGVMPGIESWYDMGNKSKTGAKKAVTKMHHVAEHVNEILRHIPYVQTNFILGLDTDEGPEPFELTKQFAALVPGALPYVTLLTSFGQAAAINLDYQRNGRVLPFPFHFLNNSDVSNIRPKNFSWPQFFDLTIDLRNHLWSPAAIARRFVAMKRSNAGWLRWMNLWRAISSERRKLRRYRELRVLLEGNSEVRRYWDGETNELPRFYLDWIRSDLGPLWDHLPQGALQHDPNAYLADVEATRGRNIGGPRTSTIAASAMLHGRGRSYEIAAPAGRLDA